VLGRLYINLEYHPHDSRIKIALDDIVQALTARMGTGGNNVPLVLSVDIDKENNMDSGRMRVRRLTPLECERLQGFPDNWTLVGEPYETKEYEYDGEITKETLYKYEDLRGKKKKVSDAVRYRAIGNSIALPFWQHLATKICKIHGDGLTVGSLFDGIGGFPLVFKRAGAETLWTSEIEDFQTAVVKERLG